MRKAKLKNKYKQSISFKRDAEVHAEFNVILASMSERQEKLYNGITESGLFSLEATKDSFKDVKRLRP